MSLQIIIPVYNTAKYLNRCFDSLVVDDCYYIKKYHISILFVNDGSTDNSQAVIDKLQTTFDFVSSINQSNQGLAAARNLGIKHINSRHYALLDSDDWIDMPQFCEVYKEILQKKLDIISFGLSYYNEKNEFTGHRPNQKVLYDNIYTGIEFLEQGYQPSSACLFIYDRNFIVKNKLFYYPGITQEDVEHTFRMMLHVNKGLFIENKVYKYFRRSDSDTMTTSTARVHKYLLDSIKVANLIAKNLERETVKTDSKLTKLTQKTYNSVVWNLLWRFVSKPKELDKRFKIDSLKELKNNKLYPIKGPLKTKFQKLSTLFFNQEWLLRLYFKFSSK